jgi:hypothetical protein
MSDENSEKSNKIEKIYRIIEFEIDNANNQISLSKKDNINFILLIFALIGLFAFVPADTFFYEWIPSGLWMTIILMGLVGGFSIICYYIITTKEKSNNENATNIDNNEKCVLCKSSAICKNIDDPVKKEKMRNYTKSLLITTIGLFFSALIYTSFIFFISCMVAYLNYSASKDITPTFQNNSWISLLFMLIFLVYCLLYVTHTSLIKKGDFKKYLLGMAFFSIAIFICSAIIAIYGVFSKIPPFIAISNETQFSPLLTEHLKIIPAVPLSYIVTLYTLVIGLVLFEFFVSSQYIRGINQKLRELLILKYRIDRYQLGISPDLDIEDLIKQLSKLKISPPSYFIAGGIITIPVPLPYIRCEEMVYSALEDQPEGEPETLQR